MLDAEVEPQFASKPRSFGEALEGLDPRTPHRERRLLSHPLFVVATIVAKPERADDLRALLVSAVAAFRQEDGCIGYLLYEDEGQAGRFVT